MALTGMYLDACVFILLKTNLKGNSGIFKPGPYTYIHIFVLVCRYKSLTKSFGIEPVELINKIHLGNSRLLNSTSKLSACFCHRQTVILSAWKNFEISFVTRNTSLIQGGTSLWNHIRGELVQEDNSWKSWREQVGLYLEEKQAIIYFHFHVWLYTTDFDNLHEM